MRTEKIINIKNPRLVRIRNNLRNLIREHFNHLLRQNFNSRQGFPFGDPRRRKLHLQRNKLIDQFKRSICICYRCSNNTRDMVYLPSSKIWICIECYRKDKYAALLKHTLPLSKAQIREFLNKLAGDDGIRHTRHSSRSGSDDYWFSREILKGMGFSGKEQRHFLKLCICYGGYCDSEILMNAAPLLLDEYTTW